MTNGEWLKGQAEAMGFPMRTLDQVKKTLARAKKNGADVSMANLMLSHGRLSDDATKYVSEYVS